MRTVSQQAGHTEKGRQYESHVKQVVLPMTAKVHRFVPGSELKQIQQETIHPLLPYGRGRTQYADTDANEVAAHAHPPGPCPQEHCRRLRGRG